MFFRREMHSLEFLIVRGQPRGGRHYHTQPRRNASQSLLHSAQKAEFGT